MVYKVTRYEKNKDHAGNIVSIFLALNVGDFNKEYWLTTDEVAAVLKDETALTPILEAVAAQGEIDHEAFLEVQPQPAEIADETKKASFAISPAKVASAKTAIVAKIEADKIKADSTPVMEAPIDSIKV